MRETVRWRVWPAVLLVALMGGLRFVLPLVDSEWVAFGVFAVLLGAPGMVIWWLFFSRAPQAERWIAALIVVLAAAAVLPFLHVSMATGMQGLLYPVYAAPGLALAFLVWALAARGLEPGPRRLALAGLVLLACAPWALVRTGGFTAALDHDFAWRFEPTAEERLLAAGDETETAEAGETAEVATSGPAEWPGFRGPARDGVVRDAPRIETDWAASPPELVWRRPVGPGWSSFAVHGARVYTQEQRGEEEVVACYDRDTGEPVWRHADTARFWESNAGAGPRGTPTLADGRVYTLGATGIVNALDAADGALVWTRDGQADTGAERPEWAFSGSPLVVGELVVVPLAGALVAYDRATGEPRWSGPTEGGGYSSAQLVALAGVDQLLFTSSAGVAGIEPATGARLWDFAVEGDPIVQPVLTADGDVLISVTAMGGVQRLSVAREGGAWTVAEDWRSTRLKPYFNDFVQHGGHAYGFDGGILACIDLADGARAWKGGRYGRGQLVLLPDQDALLVLGEAGEVALVAAEPHGFSELARFQAIESKTWNHPVVVGDRLFVRNAEEMAAYRLPLASP